MRYLVPLGAMAVLLLMLVPKYVSQPAVYDSVAPSVEPVGAPDTFVAPAAKRGMDQNLESFSTMMMEDGVAPMAEGNDLRISFQTPGVVVLVDYVSLLEPGFVVITRSENGQAATTILGVSYLLFAGYNEQIEIPLSESMKAGETFCR